MKPSYPPHSSDEQSGSGTNPSGRAAFRSIVLFDIDGTLIRRAGPHHKTALIEGIRVATGLATTLHGVDTAGMLDRDLIAVMMRNAGASERAIARSLNSAMHACQTFYAENCAADLSDCVCPGIRQSLQGLKDRGAMLGVVSGNLSNIGWKKLELAGLRSFFTVAAWAEDGRTRARLALLAARRARKAGAAGRVSLVGDHLNDIHAARQNGFQSIGVATGILGANELAAAQPDILVRDLTELNLDQLL